VSYGVTPHTYNWHPKYLGEAYFQKLLDEFGSDGLGPIQWVWRPRPGRRWLDPPLPRYLSRGAECEGRTRNWPFITLNAADLQSARALTTVLLCNQFQSIGVSLWSLGPIKAGAGIW